MVGILQLQLVGRYSSWNERDLAQGRNLMLVMANITPREPSCPLTPVTFHTIDRRLTGGGMGTLNPAFSFLRQ